MTVFYKAQGGTYTPPSQRAHPLHLFNIWVTRISIGSAMVAALLLFSGVLIVTWMVLARNIGLQTSWELEASIEIMVIAVFLASPYTLHTNGHVRMEVLEAVLPIRVGKVLSIIAKLIGFFACLYLAWVGWQITVDAYSSGERGLGAWAPLVWPKYASMAFGMALTALQYIVIICQPVHQNQRGTENV